jgi:hypothetical protein
MAAHSASLLRAFARYMKENPNVPEEKAIEAFVGIDRSEEEEARALATPESCIATGPQPIPKRAAVRYIRSWWGRVGGRLTGSVD